MTYTVKEIFLTQSDGDPPDGRAWVCFWGNAVKCAKSGGAG